MKVLVTGATGAIGPRVVRRLVAAGHAVTAVARTPEKAAVLRDLGARPVTIDLFDPGAVAEAVRGHDAVCNLATSIPSLAKAGLPGAFAENDRIRTEISRNVADAAIASGAVVVQESIAFTYEDRGDEWIDESTPIAQTPITASVATAEANAARVTAAGGRGIVLRFGLFYAPDTAHTQDMAAMAARGLAPVLGHPDGYMPFVHLDDAAAAVVAALDAPAGTYNVTDDEPLRRREVAETVAAALAKKRLLIAPVAVAKAAGPKAEHVRRSHRVSNRRFKEATGWSPSVPSARTGFPAAVVEVLSSRPASDRRSQVLRLILVLLAATAAYVGLWAQLAPASFYDGFPGFGRQWISVDGPFNEHLIRDVGGLNLALAGLTAVAAVTLRPTVVRTAVGAWLVYSVPHLLYHLAHRDVFTSAADAASSLGGLTQNVVLPLVALALLRPRRTATGAAPSPAPAVAGG